jgi:hypothetical protein
LCAHEGVHGQAAKQRCARHAAEQISGERDLEVAVDVLAALVAGEGRLILRW